MSAAMDVAPAIPRMAWRDVHNYVNKSWDPQNTPHHSIVGLTGSGKSYLAVNGILRGMCATDRVIIFDSKLGSDKTIADTPAQATHTLPRHTWGRARLGRQPEPYDGWHRVVLSHDYQEAHRQVGETLERVWREGNYVVLFDELRSITDTRSPGLNHLPLVNRLYMMGRAKGISLISCAQSPVWCPNTFYDQCSYAWIGRIRDETRQKRLLEIGGLTKAELPVIKNLDRRNWLLCADNGEFFATTKVDVNIPGEGE